jgi:hypothetical protein
MNISKNQLICNICGNEIDTSEDIFRRDGERVHGACANRKDSSQSEEKSTNLKDNNTGSAITKIDLSWGNVFWLTWQFLVVGLVLAIPVWILVMILFAIAS